MDYGEKKVLETYNSLMTCLNVKITSNLRGHVDNKYHSEANTYSSIFDSHGLSELFNFTTDKRRSVLD